MTPMHTDKKHAIRLAVLASGGGTTFENLVEEMGAGRLDATCAVMVASRNGIGAIEKAGRTGVECAVVERKAFADVGRFSREVFRHIDAAGADLVCLAGWLCMLEIPEKWRGRIINIHPALLPSFGGKGMYGAKVHAAVIAHGCKVSGCTVHFVDEHYDNGPIILQRVCPVMEDDRPEDLAHRVFEEEKIAYPEAIRLYAAGRLRIEGRRVRVL
jgi:phosphoribosylglycinamide formyltransferase-1